MVLFNLCSIILTQNKDQPYRSCLLVFAMLLSPVLKIARSVVTPDPPLHAPPSAPSCPLSIICNYISSGLLYTCQLGFVIASCHEHNIAHMQTPSPRVFLPFICYKDLSLADSYVIKSFFVDGCRSDGPQDISKYNIQNINTIEFLLSFISLISTSSRTYLLLLFPSNRSPVSFQ